MDYNTHQERCLDRMLQNTCGKIILPTGTGKSRIEFEHSKRKLVRDDGIHQVVIILAPRIILCQQLLTNFYNFMVEKYSGRPPEEVFTFVSSGNVPSISANGKIISGEDIGKNTTIIKEIVHDLVIASRLNVDSIIFSTYKSFDRCMAGIREYFFAAEKIFEVHLIADEAHYFVNSSGDKKDNTPFEALKENLELFTTRFFFTATPKIFSAGNENESGMDNQEVYGNIVYEEQPKYFISKGIICEPRLHRVEMSEHITSENFDQHAGDALLKIFSAHEKIINEYTMGGKPSTPIRGKVIVAVEGSRQLDTLIKNGFYEKAREAGINVGWTMSNAGIKTRFNGETLKTEKLLEKIKEICYNKDGSTNHSSRLMLLHYDRLSEGIDVPSMTGLIVLRDMNKTKKVQNIGRVLRTCKEDHQKEYADRKKTWIKPYSYIIVPDFKGISRFDLLIEQLVNEYDASVQISTPTVAIGTEEEQPEMQGLEVKKENFKTISGIINHRVESFERYQRRIIREMESGEEIDISFRDDILEDEELCRGVVDDEF